ncbi:MAG: alginate lyase family protein [Deltaproteobacteria bacterium]|nr:alginate lyase family protein [Deltaproteobacteria bacterium]
MRRFEPGWIAALVLAAGGGCGDGDVGPEAAGDGEVFGDAGGGDASDEDSADSADGIEPDADAEDTAPDTAVDGAEDDGGGDGPAPPGVGFWHTADQLRFMREHAGADPWRAAFDGVLAEATGSLSRVPAALADFDVPPYYSDPEGHEAAKAALSGDGYAAYALALAYQLAPDRAEGAAFAAKAAEILDAWATVNRSVSGGDGDLVMAYKGVHLLYAADLLAGWPGWSPDGPATFRAWAAAVFRASAERKREEVNNHGAWGTFGAVAAAALLGDAPAVAAEVERAKARIRDSIAENGELPEENKRTNSGMWYTYFALAPLAGTAWIARNVGSEDLFAWTASNGRTLFLALDRLFYWCLHPEEWPYPLPDGVSGELWRLLYPCADEVELPTVESWPGNLFEMMSAVYGVDEWAAWVAGHRPQRGWHVWIYPTLMRDVP